MVIIAKRSAYIYNAYQWIMPESVEYIVMKDKFGAKKIEQIDKPEAK
jgi:hypothetical protein